MSEGNATPNPPGGEKPKRKQVMLANVDHLNTAITAMGSRGIPALRDFSDREATQTGVPAWLPTHAPDGQELTYQKLARDEARSHPKLVGPDAWMSPVTRDTFPDVDEKNFEVDGTLVHGDLLICVGLAENARRIADADSQRALARVSALEPKARTISEKASTGKSVDGTLASGWHADRSTVDSQTELAGLKGMLGG